jgi:alkylated DNA repair protein (DNA oxidative demethylase)
MAISGFWCENSCWPPFDGEKMIQPSIKMRGFDVFQTMLAPPEQKAVLEDLRTVIRKAPLFSPVTSTGKPMSVRMTSAGRLGWVADRGGYRYQDHHPDGRPWPDIPDSVLDLWRRLVSDTRPPDCCLINFYAEAARMGLHRDADEGDFSWPVLSISLGDDGLFRVGGTELSDPTSSIWLKSGDVVRMGGAARLAYHGVDRIRFGSSRLLPRGGRVNVTLRAVG